MAKKKASREALSIRRGEYVRFPLELYEKSALFLHNTILRRRSKAWAQLALCLGVPDLKHGLRVEVGAFGFDNKKIVNYAAENVFVMVTDRGEYPIRMRIFAFPFNVVENSNSVPVVSSSTPSVPYFEYLLNTQGVKKHEVFSIGNSEQANAYAVLIKLIQDVRIKKVGQKLQDEEKKFMREMVIAAWKMKRDSFAGAKFSKKELVKVLPVAKTRSSYLENEFRKFPRAVWAAEQIYNGKLHLEQFDIRKSDIKD